MRIPWDRCYLLRFYENSMFLVNSSSIVGIFLCPFAYHVYTFVTGAWVSRFVCNFCAQALGFEVFFAYDVYVFGQIVESCGHMSAFLYIMCILLCTGAWVLRVLCYFRAQARGS